MSTNVGEEPHERTVGAHSLVTIVGFLVCVELASGILQGYYTPIFSEIADHLEISDGDVNWFEAAQLVVSALCVPAARPPRRHGRRQERAAPVHGRSPRSARGCSPSRRRSRRS